MFLTIVILIAIAAGEIVVPTVAANKLNDVSKGKLARYLYDLVIGGIMYGCSATWLKYGYDVDLYKYGGDLTAAGFRAFVMQYGGVALVLIGIAGIAYYFYDKLSEISDHLPRDTHNP